MATVEGGVTFPRGFRAGAIACGVKYEDRPDLAVIASDVPASCAGVFTSNRVKAAPVLVSRERVARGSARAIVANSGNANACTGEQGIEAAIAMAGETAHHLGCDPREVLVASTGVIGKQFPVERATRCLKKLVASLLPDGSPAAARAIMTTDTVPKETSREIDLGGFPVRIGAIAKGAGMISPDMATLLCFITTDADIRPSTLKRALVEATENSFNCITVDGDMSTNDTVLILANGVAGNPTIRSNSKNYELFRDALSTVCLEMAKAIVRDAEGATKFVTIRVTGAAGKPDARQVGRAIANSALVKTAIFGEDPNWGRIICAAGYSGIPVDEASMSIAINDQVVFENGRINACAKTLKPTMSAHDLTIDVDLGMGKAESTLYTSDLSHEYIRINAEYTT